MKKLLFSILAIAVFATQAYATLVTKDTVNVPPSPAYPYTILQESTPPINKPPMFIKRVRYGMAGANEPKLMSQMVVTWDVTSADGVTVSAIVGVDTHAQRAVAGVLVTDLLTQDSGSTDIVNDNYGYMAVGGWCLAKIVTVSCTAGYTLSPAPGPKNIGAFVTTNTSTKPHCSQDVGVLLNNPGADGGAAVWLRLQ